MKDEDICKLCGHELGKHRYNRCQGVTDGKPCTCFARGPEGEHAAALWNRFMGLRS